ncbi:MAG TPA: DarT ssDNA thymidine ADP-ribosyltransferase family protein [Xanthobacteraceae bacterium]|nr:DarT ssDNA thymidine ADP-ribosyltransferase family protein [Xanthobacteraceae bacterium]
MMYKRRVEAPNLCVLRVLSEVLTLPGAVISDQNAASDYVRFLHPQQWRSLDFDAIYALDWRHPDYILDWKKSWRAEDKKRAVASAIRNLVLLGWLRLNISESLTEAT